VHQRINRLKELDDVDFDDVAGSSRTKKELLHMRRERIKLDKTLGGIREMSRTPSAVWIVDTNKEHLAVEEARKLKIPIIAILDSNCDPDLVDYPIPGNDDAIRAVGLLTRVIADAVADGLIARSGVKTEGDAKGIGTDEPLADWERDLLQGEADKAAVAATGGDEKAEETPAVEATGAASEAAEAKDAAATVEAPAAVERAAAPEAAAAEVAPETPAAEETPTAPAAEATPEAPAAEEAAEAPAAEAPADTTDTSADAPAEDAAQTKES
jgi:small subunit ribosomal protein S2